MVSPLVKPGVQLKEEIPHEVGAADTDEDGLRHILLNLLGNAVKFTDVGEVVVHARIKGQANGRAMLIVSWLTPALAFLPTPLPPFSKNFNR